MRDAVVKKYSTDPTSKDNGGVLANVQKGQGEKVVRATRCSPRSWARSSGPVKTTDGYYVFEVTKATPEKVQPLTRQLKESIRQIVMSENERTALTKFGKEYQDRWRGQDRVPEGLHRPGLRELQDEADLDRPAGRRPAADQQQAPQQTTRRPAG